jgi:hypothetical protein
MVTPCSTDRTGQHGDRSPEEHHQEHEPAEDAPTMRPGSAGLVSEQCVPAGSGVLGRPAPQLRVAGYVLGHRLALIHPRVVRDVLAHRVS